MAKTVKMKLSGGHVAIVDACDFPVVEGYRWYATRPTKAHKYPYAISKIGRKTVYMHRLILRARKGQIVDHIDRNGLNNSRKNLRICTDTQNKGNMAIRSTLGKTSRFKGVYFNKKTGYWEAYIDFKKKRTWLGKRFTDEVEAAKVYNKAAVETFGEFARLNPVRARR